MSVSPARRAAFEVVRRVRERAAWGQPTLDAVLRDRPLSPEDAALATRLAYGTLQAFGVLGEALDARLDKPRALEPRVRDALLVAAYELLFSRTPAHAAVSQWVDQVRSLRPQAAGLANAVLRRLAADAPAFPWGDPATDLDALARQTLHPRWIVDEWVSALGEENAREALAADSEPAPFTVWANPFLGTFEDALARLAEDGAEPGPCDPPGCIRCGRPSSAVNGAAVKVGTVLVADAAAQVAAHVVGAHPAGLVVDAAAGRGTKTVQLQAESVSAGEPATLFALDVHAFKTRLLRERLDALGVPGVVTLTGDASRPQTVDGLPPGAFADAVLVDAPCSGLGTLRRRPEKRWRLAPADLDELSALQLSMLAGTAGLVRPGGLLVYSTCSVSLTENTSVVDAFLGGDRGAAFRREHLTPRISAPMRRFVDENGDFRSWPTAGGPDGHYVAALRRTR